MGCWVGSFTLCCSKTVHLPQHTVQHCALHPCTSSHLFTLKTETHDIFYWYYSLTISIFFSLLLSFSLFLFLFFFSFSFFFPSLNFLQKSRDETHYVQSRGHVGWWKGHRQNKTKWWHLVFPHCHSAWKCMGKKSSVFWSREQNAL